MIEETNDQRNGKQLGVHFDVVRQTRERFNDDSIIRHVLKDRITRQIEERRTKLETSPAEETPKIQGQIQGLRLAMAAIDERQ